MADIIRCTLLEMLAILNAGNKGAKALTIRASTYPDMLKKDRETGQPNPYKHGVRRLQLRTVQIGVNYEDGVNRAQFKEMEQAIAAIVGDSEMPENEKIQRLMGLRQSMATLGTFRAEGLWSGHGLRVEGQPYCVRHDSNPDRWYWATRPYQHASTDPDSITGTVTTAAESVWHDMATGTELDPRTLTGLLPTEYKATKQGLDHDLAWRTFALDGGYKGTAGYLTEVRYGGKRYEIANNAPVPATL